MLVETYQLSSFPSTYGAGRVIRTFTLAPGEKTKISVKTYTKRQTDSKSASSILDSFSQESADDFETSLQTEQSNKEAYNETFEYNAEAEASASWGWGDANASGGVKGGTNATREEFAKSVSNATQKHSAKASAKREVHIDTSYEVKEEQGEETSIEREIQNINLSRVLNLVFRQMNQEFVSILHLVDVRVAFFNGFAESKIEVPVSQLDQLLDAVVLDQSKAEVRTAIRNQLLNIMNYKDELVPVIEDKALPNSSETYTRIRRDLVSKHQDPITSAEFKVPGIILAVSKTVMRTEGVVVEAMLGEGEALDDYARQLQDLEVKKRTAEAVQATAMAERAALINKLAESHDKEGSDILTSLTCPCGCSDSVAVNVNSPQPGVKR